MSDFNPENHSSFDQIGSEQDLRARQDLDKTVLAFDYLSRADEISRQIESSQPKLDPRVVYFNPAVSAAALMELGIQVFRERRAMRYSEKGKLLLNEIDQRSKE
jgi:hypothetical protein